MGSLVSKAAQDRVLRCISIGKKEGARLVTGGEPTSTEDMKGGYLADVKQSITIASEEIFGPFMSVLTWTDEEELFKQVNDVEYDLTRAIFTSDITTAQKAIGWVETGTMRVNTVATHFLSL